MSEAGALVGIGFTMSLFIAGQAFPTASDFAAAKVAVFAASVLSSLIGVALLWAPGVPRMMTTQPRGRQTGRALIGQSRRGAARRWPSRVFA